MFDPSELKEARGRLGLTQQNLADEMGVHIRVYRRYENLEQDVPADRMHFVKAIILRSLPPEHQFNEKSANCLKCGKSYYQTAFMPCVGDKNE